MAKISLAALRGFAVVLLGVLSLGLVAVAQEPLQFNVPYRCADGSSYVIEKCGMYGRFEMCTWRQEKNGQVITTANSERAQMYGRLKPCPVQAAAKPATPGPTARQPGQPMNPPYMKEFPSVDRVMKEIQGSDPQDTLLRQTGAFRQLKQILQDSTGDRWLRNQLTPDETRIYGEYDVAYNNLAKQTNFPLGGYGTDPKFHEELFTRFSMTGVRAAYDKANAKSLARHKQFVAANNPPANTAGAQPAARSGNPALINDPTAVATRRCLELGGAELECVGSGLLNGIIGMTGIDPGKLTGPARAGLRVTGSYNDNNGMQLVFGDDSVAISGCGKLVPDGHGYTVGKIGSQLAIQIQNQPKAILLAFGPDGKLVGPGAVDVTGRVITGYHNVTMYKRYTRDNSIVPGSAYTEKVPDYGPATARCTIGPLPTSGSVSSAGNALMNVLDTLDPTKSDAEKARDDAKKATPPGPRLVGTYTSAGGLKLEFATDNVIIDCAQAHARQNYSVQNTPAQMLITVQNGTASFTLAFQANGSLSGPASVNVSGKLVTDITDNGVVFAPTSSTCAVGAMISK